MPPLGLGLGLGLTTQTTAGGPSGPVNTVAPAITGTVNVGQTLTTTNGTWTGTGTITFARQWVNSVSGDISGATGLTYVLQSSDEGDNITCRVTATDDNGSTVAVSNSVGPVIVPPVTAYASDASGTIINGTNLNSGFLLGGREPGTNYRGYVRFSSIVAAQGATVTSAILTVNQPSQTGSLPPVRILNLDTAPALVAADIAGAAFAAPSTPMTSGTGAKSYDVTAHVQAILNRAGWVSGNSMMICASELAVTGATDFVQWRLFNDATPANRPVLTITL